MSDATGLSTVLYPPVSLPASDGLLGRLLRRQVRDEPTTDLDRRLAIARRSGMPLVLGSVASPFDGAALPALAERLRREPPVALRLVVARLRPERDPALLADLDETHAVEVDVVAADLEAAGALETAAALVARGVAVRLVTPVPAGEVDEARVAELGRAAQDVGAAGWVLAGSPSEAATVAHRRVLLGLGLGDVAGRG